MKEVVAMAATAQARPVTVGETHTIEHAALIRRANERLAKIDDIRAAVRLSEAGKPQREIAEILHVTQPVVHRLLRAARVVGEVDGSPEEMILRAFVGGTSREMLVEQLSRHSYTFPGYAPYPHEGKTPSTWDQVAHAVVAGFLSMEEYLRVHAAVQPPPAQ